MSTALTLWLPFNPPKSTSQQQTRIGMVKGKPMIFKDKKHGAAQATYDAVLARYSPPVPISGPYRLHATIIYPLLAKDTQSKALRQRLEEWGLVPHTSKPDADNAVKHPHDRLIALAFVKDDSDCIRLEVEKYRGESPGIYLELVPFDEQRQSQMARAAFQRIKKAKEGQK